MHRYIKKRIKNVDVWWGKEKHEQRRLVGIPFYDPLWQLDSPEKYLYVLHKFALENKMRGYPIPRMYLPRDESDKQLYQGLHFMTAIMPRMVCDFPHHSVKDAEELVFSHEYIYEKNKEKFEKGLFIEKSESSSSDNSFCTSSDLDSYEYEQ